MLSRLRLVLPVLIALVWVPASHAAVPPDFVGVTSEDAFARDDPYRAATMARQRAVGIGLLRQVLDWSYVEISPGRYDFSVYDGYVREAAANGIAVLPLLYHPPDFQRRHRGRSICPPTRLEAMADYARAAVRRYGPNGSLWRKDPAAPRVPIRSWQIWNEPNVPQYWCKRPNAREYASMLRVVGGAIKSQDPGAEIVAAGIPETRLVSAIPLDGFLRGLYRAGGARYFDTLAIHGYAKNKAGVSQLLHGVRQIMNRNGDRRAQIWVTEIGWGDVGPSHRFIVGAAGQAARITGAFKVISALRRKLRLRGVVYYSWRDATPYPPRYKDMWALHTGLLDVDNNPKPALQAFGDAVSVLGVERPPLPPGEPPPPSELPPLPP